MIGQRAGHFVIKHKLGEGGMGEVFLAEHEYTRRKAAIKVLLPQWTQNQTIVQRFMNEALAMGALKHTNVVDVIDCGQLASGAWYIAMEYLDGGTLGRFCESQGGPLSIHVALQILAQVAAGLGAAHEHAMVHRDLKPENIFLTIQGSNQHHVKILDWGISKLGERDGHGAITSVGMVAGTPQYMAPEQMRDLRTADHRVDIYALGVIAYQMVTGGCLPFQRPDRPDEYLSPDSPIDPRRHVPDVNDTWASAILSAIHVDRARRPQSARAFILLLAKGTPGDAFAQSGIQIVQEYAPELLEIGNLEETVRGPKPASTPRAASRYRIGDQLGAGGMAEVFRATQLGAEGVSHAVAIKRVLPGFSTVPQFASMFVQEARLASLLDHPNIVSVRDFDRDEEGRLFLAMELVDGRDLASLVTTGRVPFSAIIFIISEALHGLGYAHNLPTADGPRGVIHRDVSPQNVLLSWEGAVKVSDFGIAKAREASAATASTMIKGKPQYMSPEQANGEALDGRSDLFAVGIMLWELLTGRRLFEGSTHETLARIVFGRIDPPSSVAADVPRDLEAVTMRLLARERDARYPNAEAAILDLSQCANAPRNGRIELVRLLAERFPAAVAARSSRPNTPKAASAQSRATVREKSRDGAATRRDANPQPTPAMPWSSNTTLDSAASQAVERPRTRRIPLMAVGVLGIAATTATIVYGVARTQRSEAPTAATLPDTPKPTHIPSPKLAITTDPAAAIVRVGGVEHGPSPVTLATEAGTRLVIEARRDGFESASQVITIGRESQTVLLTLRPVVVSAPVDAGAPDAPPPVVTPPPKRSPPPRTPVTRPPPDGTFDPDDVVD